MDGILCLDGKVGYRYVAKAGCTSVKRLLYQLETGSSYDGASARGTVHSFFRSPRYAKSIDSAEYKFVVVRDPVARFMSAYSNRVRHHSELSPDYIAGSHPKLLDEIPVFNPGIGQFIDFFDQYCEIAPIRHHTRPLVSYLNGEGLSGFDDVIPLAELDLLPEKLAARVGTDVGVIGRFQSRGRKVPLKELSETQVSWIIDRYRDDYALLGDFFSPGAVWDAWRSAEVHWNRKKRSGSSVD